MTETAATAPIEGQATPIAAETASGVRVFSFGDPEPVLNRPDLLEMLQCWDNGRYYEPPVPLAALSRAVKVSPHHSSALQYKVLQLARDFIPHPLLSRFEFEALAMDFCTLANAYVERIDNLGGRPLQLKRSIARFTRRGIRDGAFYFVNAIGQEHEFATGSVFQLMRPSLDQEVYGIPDYLSAMQSALLSEAAVLFRRKYFLNGSHAGFIMYISEEKLDDADADQIETALKESKGVGNFKNLLLHIPGGKEKGVQLIHPGEVAAKDEFLGIKSTTRDDILAAHRVPPVLIGVMPQNAGGLGDPAKAEEVFHFAEIVPLQQRFLAINDWLGQEVIRFQPRERMAAGSAG